MRPYCPGVQNPPAIFQFQHFADVLDDPSHPEHPASEFDWSGVDPDTKQEAIDTARCMTVRAMHKLADFIISGGHSKTDGPGLRAMIFAWAIHPKFRETSQVELAEMLGFKHKQSIGRVVAMFRAAFDWVDDRFYSAEAREQARLREQTKRLQVC